MGRGSSNRCVCECGRSFTRHLGNAPRGPDYLARGCSGRKLLLVRGYFCAWTLICDPEESSVLLATPTREHVKFVGDVLHVTLLHVSLCRLYTAPLHLYVYIGAIIDSTLLSMVQQRARFALQCLFIPFVLSGTP